MIKKVTEYIEDHSMIDKGDKIILALSGGPDSICLLHMLQDLKDLHGIQLHAAHINHCLRGEESDGDEEYVKRICSELQIPLHIKRVDIHKYSLDKGLSCETAIGVQKQQRKGYGDQEY